jgi:PAS domain S-box-containing protein
MRERGESERSVSGGRGRGWAAIGLLAALFLAAWLASWFSSSDSASTLALGLLAAAGVLALGFLGLGAIEPLARQTQEAEARAVRADERQETLVAAVGEAVVELDEQGVIVAFNPGAVRLFGYPEHEALGARVQMLISELEVRDGSPALARESLGRRRDGVEIQLEVELSPRTAVGRRFLVARDASRLRAAEALARASEDERRQLAAAAHEAILGFDSEGRIQEANPAAERLTGRSWSQLAGRDLCDTLLHRDQRAAFRRDLRESQAAGDDRLALHGGDVELWVTGQPAIPARVRYARAGSRWFAFILPQAGGAQGGGQLPQRAEPRAGDGRPTDRHAPELQGGAPRSASLPRRRGDEPG